MDWKRVKLKDILEKPISGEWGKEAEEDSTTSVNVIRTTNFSNDGRIKLADVVKREIDSKKVEQKKLKYGDIIIEKSGGSPNQPVGRVIFFNLDSEEIYLCNNFTSVLRCKEGIYSKYVLYYLLCAYKKRVVLKFQNKTTGIINLQLSKYLEKVEIALPPMDVQIKIASALDKAQELIDNRKAQIEKYDELLQAVFMDMFGDPVTNPKGWEVVKFEKTGSLQRGKSKHRPRNAPELLGGNYPLIQTGDVSRSGIYITEHNQT